MGIMAPMSCLRMLLLLLWLVWSGPLRGAPKEGWVEAKSPHFVAYCEAGEGDAREALKGFEAIRSVFSEVFPGLRVDPPKPMFILAVKDEASMKRFLPREFAGKDPRRLAGAFVQGLDRNYAIIRLDVGHQGDQPYFTVFHEYAHSILHLNFASLPTWLDEGLADFFGATELQSERVHLGRLPRGRLDEFRAKGQRLSLETMLTVTHDSPHYQEGAKAGIFYAQSWALVHYLLLDPQATKAGLFQAHLNALDAGLEPLAAAQKAFGDLEKLKLALLTYSKGWQFRYLDLPLTVNLTDRDFQARPLGEAEALVLRAEFLLCQMRESEAQPLLDQALALDARRPEVYVAIGCRHVRKGATEKARSALEAAMRLGSQDFRAPYYLAILSQGGTGSKSASAAQILGWLESARRLRPDSPDIHMALCHHYARDPRAPAKAVQEGSAAVRLEPQNLFHRLQLGEVCMRLDLEKEARLIGEQLNRLATPGADKVLAEAYAASLAQFLERRRTEAAATAAPLSPEGGRLGPMGDPDPLKFSLPAYLQPLGLEVQQLVLEGKTDEAIRKVEQAIAQAKYPYDKQALRPLLETLRARAGSK